jgi:hypothetical protein
MNIVFSYVVMLATPEERRADSSLARSAADPCSM